MLRWYDRTHRPLPWRATPKNVYHQWLAEVMLQQTQVATVIPYYERFVNRYPTIEKLAHAKLGDVLKEWAGLGYYSRARNLHKAAGLVVCQYGGQFPKSAAELQTLPGIGRYTAGAIASIAYDERAAILDGNVKRVLSRLFLVRQDVGLPKTANRLWRLSESLLPNKRCGDFNQSLMELGATVCTPQKPNCPDCPLSDLCLAHIQGKQSTIPRKARRVFPKELVLIVMVIRSGRYFWVRRRPSKGLWGGLWEFPTLEKKRSVSEQAAVAGLLTEIKVDSSRFIVASQRVGMIECLLTHRRVKMRIYQCGMKKAELRTSKLQRWATLDRIRRMGVSAAQLQVLSKIEQV